MELEKGMYLKKGDKIVRMHPVRGNLQAGKRPAKHPTDSSPCRLLTKTYQRMRVEKMGLLIHNMAVSIPVKHITEPRVLCLFPLEILG